MNPFGYDVSSPLHDDHDIEGSGKSTLYVRTLIEASLDPFFILSPSGLITEANSATELVTGVSLLSLIGTEFCSYFTDPDEARKECFHTFFTKMACQ